MPAVAEKGCRGRGEGDGAPGNFIDLEEAMVAGVFDEAEPGMVLVRADEISADLEGFAE